MDKVKHEINAALSWLEEGNVERVKLHLGFALRWLNDEASQPRVQRTGLKYCPECGDSEFEDICKRCGFPH